MTFDKQQILTLLQANRLAEAHGLCRQMCETNRQDPEAWFLLAGIHAQRGELEQVAACCEQVLALQPHHAAARYNLGVARQAQGRFYEAADCYREVLRQLPAHAQAHANLGLVLRETGEPAAAEASCRQALAYAPDLPEAHNTLGLLLKDQGRLEEAADCFRQALRAQPALAQAHYNLGLCHAGRDQPAQAEACFREALRLNPDYPEAHNDLGVALQAQGRLEQARASYRRALELKPDYPEAHNNLGLTWTQSNPALAASHFRQALALRPGHAAAHNNLAGVLLAQGQPEEAIEHYRRALELKPDYAEAYNNLGNVMRERFRYSDAEQCYRNALQNRPDFAEAFCGLAVTLQDNGRYDEAMTNYQQAVELKSNYADALSGMAVLMEREGKIAEAQDILDRLTKDKVQNINVALAYAALSSHTDCQAEAAELLERLMKTEEAIPRHREMHFALGTLYDELGDYDKAFMHYARGNSLIVTGFDTNECRGRFDALIAAFAADEQARRPRASNNSHLPIFIVGMPRSGTSLVEQILASHPLVFGAGELGHMHQAIASLPKVMGTDTLYPECLKGITRAHLDQIAEPYLIRLAEFSPQAQRVTDKMPYNFMHLGLIELLFPGARVIHCMRDPLDTCLSIHFQQFNANHAFARNLTDLGTFYNQYRRLMKHWKSMLSIPVMDVVYEELVDNQEEISRAMISFCGLSWDDRCLQFHQSSRITKTASYNQVRRPMYRKSIARWRHYAQHLSPLRKALDQHD
jgi:tetratricopeptide (TPR) repeat protein